VGPRLPGDGVEGEESAQPDRRQALLAARQALGEDVSRLRRRLGALRARRQDGEGAAGKRAGHHRTAGEGRSAHCGLHRQFVVDAM
jgi:hypothetical protein